MNVTAKYNFYHLDCDNFLKAVLPIQLSVILLSFFRFHPNLIFSTLEIPKEEKYFPWTICKDYVFLIFIK